jgi:hypothetical protein
MKKSAPPVVPELSQSVSVFKSITTPFPRSKCGPHVAALVGIHIPTQRRDPAGTVGRANGRFLIVLLGTDKPQGADNYFPSTCPVYSWPKSWSAPVQQPSCCLIGLRSLSLSFPVIAHRQPLKGFDPAIA